MEVYKRKTHRLFRRLRDLYADYYYSNQLRVLYSWATKHYRNRECIVQVSLPFQNDLIRLSKGHTKDIGKGRSSKVDIIVCQAGRLTDVIEQEKLLARNTWHPVFRSRDIEIWESKITHSKEPLRFGLSPHEKRLVLQIAREAAQTYLKTSVPAVSIPRQEGVSDRMEEPLVASVAFWVEGSFRGCSIREGLSLYEVIIEASAAACRDARFKPISLEDLKRARIEVAIMSDLRVPLTRKLLLEDAIDPTVGYCVESSGKRGWYLPEVFNTARFTTLAQLIFSLAIYKAGILQKEISDAEVSAFLVDNFVETFDQHAILELHGPMAVGKKIQEADFSEMVRSMGIALSNQLIDIQEPDGNIPPSVDVRTGLIKQIDWARLGWAVSALALFGESIGEEKYTAAAKRGFNYLSTNLYTHPHIPFGIKIDALIMFGNAAATLHNDEELHKIISLLSDSCEQIREYEYNPIRFTAVASFFLDHTNRDSSLLKKAEWFAEKIDADLIEKINRKIPVHLAMYAELAVVFQKIFQLTDEPRYKQRVRKTTDWLVGQQLPNGAFPSSNNSSLAPYTRGVGKIFEVLCFQFPTNKENAMRAFEWLHHMQYDEENTYFVKSSIRENVLGALRHDYLNQDIWTDSSAHVLIGLSRIIKWG